MVYVNDFNGFKEIGICVFIIREKVCDFVVIELLDFFLDVCDVIVWREDKRKVNVKLCIGNLYNVGLVYKIGVRMDVISRCIMSLEYYDKELDIYCWENIFLVKGLNGLFFEEGESEFLVFCRFNFVK